MGNAGYLKGGEWVARFRHGKTSLYPFSNFFEIHEYITYSEKKLMKILKCKDQISMQPEAICAGRRMAAESTSYRHIENARGEKKRQRVEDA
jgi:hypothetical protein